MGLNGLWHQEIISSLKKIGIEAEIIQKNKYCLLFIPGKALVINLISIFGHPEAQDLCRLQEEYQLKNILLVQLWEDVWSTKSEQVMARIKSILGLNRRVHGRKTQVEKITTAGAALFMDLYHIQGAATGRYSYALRCDGEIVAVAVFSHKRKMKNKGVDYTSAELIRFASRDGITVIGGLTKLLQHYVKEQGPNDIMSYADRDWSVGRAYVSSGFEYISETLPLSIYLNTRTFERLVAQRDFSAGAPFKEGQYNIIFNTGSLKYIYHP